MRFSFDKRDRLLVGVLLLIMAISAAAITQTWAIAYFASAVFLAVLVVYLSFLTWCAFASRYWPTVPSQGVRAHVRKSRGKRSTSYSLVVRYEYSVGGTEYTGTRLRYPFAIFVSVAILNKDARYLNGRRDVAVHYNPSAPSHCALRPGLSVLDGGALIVFYVVVLPVIVVLTWLGVAEIISSFAR